MVGMAPRLCIVLSCLPLALLGGCSSGSQAAKCVPGASVACACPTSQQGAQICNSAGTTFGACTCSVPPSLDAAADVPTAASDLANESHLGPDAQPDTQILGSNTPEPGRDSGAGTEVQIDATQPDAQSDSSSAPPLLTIAANYTSSSDLGFGTARRRRCGTSFCCDQRVPHAFRASDNFHCPKCECHDLQRYVHTSTNAPLCWHLYDWATAHARPRRHHWPDSRNFDRDCCYRKRKHDSNWHRRRWGRPGVGARRSIRGRRTGLSNWKLHNTLLGYGVLRAVSGCWT